MRNLFIKEIFTLLAAMLVAVVIIKSGVFSNTSDSVETPKIELSPGALYAMAFPDLNEKSQPLAQWAGKPLVINFWATWCAPCVEEIPLLIRMQSKFADQHLVIIGVGMEKPEKLKEFATKMGMNYPVLAGLEGGTELSARTGNQLNSLPFTIFIDRGGHVAGSHVGALEEMALDQQIQNILTTK